MTLASSSNWRVIVGEVQHRRSVNGAFGKPSPNHMLAGDAYPARFGPN
jgi:hypothetical protein